MEIEEIIEIIEIIEVVGNFIRSNAISICSLIIALLSALFTFLQSRTAKKALGIQERMYKDGQSNLNLEILDNFIFDDLKNKEVYFFFRTVINNLSDNPTSIQTYSLYLICSNLI